MIQPMVFLQALYGLLLAAKMRLTLSALGQKCYAAMLSGERRHRSLSHRF